MTGEIEKGLFGGGWKDGGDGDRIRGGTRTALGGFSTGPTMDPPFLRGGGR